MSLLTSFTIIGRTDDIHQDFRGGNDAGVRVTISKKQSELPQKSTEVSEPAVLSTDNPFSTELSSGQDRRNFLYTSTEALDYQDIHDMVPMYKFPKPSTFGPKTQMRNTSTVTSKSTPSRLLLLATTSDEQNLSPYQCLLREQIELFEATSDYFAIKAQGRNNPIQVGQVGIRCRHCVPVTPFNQLDTSAIQFSMSVNGIYQVSLKMGRSHFHGCRLVPDKVKKQLLELRELPRKRARGRQYWKETLEAQGLMEDGSRLRFRPAQNLGHAIKKDYARCQSKDVGSTG